MNNLIARVILLTCLSACLCACYETHIVRDSWQDLRNQADLSSTKHKHKKKRRALSQEAQLRTVTQEYFYTILIQIITGPKHQKRAKQLIKQLQQKKHLPDLWIRPQGGQTWVCRGKYSYLQDPAAVSDLRQMHLILWRGERPWIDTQLIKIITSKPASTQAMDIKQYVGQNKWALQVAVYDEAFGPNYQKAAQKAAATLRKNGSNAFYYHGPYRSMVLVGLLAYQQAWVTRMGTSAAYSPRVQKLRKQYPYNLYNGRTIVEKENGRKIRDQPSFLVKIR